MLRSLAPLFALALAGCGISVDWDGPAVAGSGVSQTETRPVAAFDRIDLSGDFDVEVDVGRARSVVVTGDDNLLPLVRTEVRGRTLHIEAQEDYRARDDVGIAIAVESLEGFHSGGSSDVVIRGVRSSGFDVGVSGSSELAADGEFGDLEASLSGSGEIRMEGTADAIDASVSGSGELDLRQVRARSARVDVSGSADVIVDVSERLVASVSGSGDVRYAGSPTVERDVSGSGAVEPL